MFDWLTDGDFLGGAASLAGTGFSIYKGLREDARAEDYYDRAMSASDSGLSNSQRKQLAKDQYSLERARIAQEKADINSLRPQVRQEMVRGINLYRPVEDQFVANARKGLDPEDMAGRAATDVRQSFGQSRTIQNRSLARQGLSPTAGSTQEFNRQSHLAEALGKAGAMTAAHRDTFLQNQNMLGNALNSRRGLPATSFTNADSMSQFTAGANQTASGLASIASSAQQGAGNWWTSAGASAGMGLGMIQNNRDRAMYEQISGLKKS
jgi:hypothetical protein